MTNIELMTALGHIYGFEVLDRGPKTITKGVTEMATEHKKCKNGCGKRAATPDGTCFRCYKKEHGESYNAVQKRTKAAGGGAVKKKEKATDMRRKGQEEREHREATGDVAALAEAAKGVGVEAFKLGKMLGKTEIVQPPEQRTRITIVTMEVYGPSPLAALIPVLEALCAR